MANVPISMTINTAEFNRWLNGVAREQVPFATAKALTMTAKDAQGDLRGAAGQSMTLRNQHTDRGLRISRAEKRDGMLGMKSEVGSIDWYAADQMDERSNIRQPQAARYRYIPVKARPNKARAIPKRLKPAALVNSPKTFWRPKPGGGALIYERIGRGGHKLRLLYVAVPRQRVEPAMSLADTVRATATRKLRRNFILSMGQAMRTVK